MSATFDDVCAELRALRAEVAELRTEQQHLARRLLSAADRRDLGALLPLVHRLLGSATWSAADLYAAALDAHDARELRTLLAEHSTECGGLRVFGNFLARCAGVTCSGLQLLDVGRARAGVLYVVRVSTASKPASPLLLRGAGAEHPVP